MQKPQMNFKMFICSYFVYLKSIRDMNLEERRNIDFVT